MDSWALLLNLFSAFYIHFSDPLNSNLAIQGPSQDTFRAGDYSYEVVFSGKGPKASPLNWNDATKYCKDKHGVTGRLANLDDQMTFEIIQAQLGAQWPGVELWVWVDGLYDVPRKQYIWRQSGINVNQPWTPWGNGEPRRPLNANKRVVYHQVTSYRAEFHTNDASHLYGYLCQFKPGS